VPLINRAAWLHCNFLQVGGTAAAENTDHNAQRGKQVTLELVIAPLIELQLVLPSTSNTIKEPSS
jgi:hypothetical protein